MLKENDELRICVAASFHDRMVGLFSRRIDKEILVIAPCKSIHTFGMGSPIDVAFLEKSGKVLESYENVPPWRVRKCRRAYAVLERRSATGDSGSCSSGEGFPAWFKKGDKVELCIKK